MNSRLIMEKLGFWLIFSNFFPDTGTYMAGNKQLLILGDKIFTNQKYT
jgi:hypothetical protein